MHAKKRGDFYYLPGGERVWELYEWACFESVEDLLLLVTDLFGLHTKINRRAGKNV